MGCFASPFERRKVKQSLISFLFPSIHIRIDENLFIIL